MTILIKIYEKNKEKNIKNVKTNKKKEKSFTLLELLIVIAVIAILAAIVVASLSGARQSAQEARGLQFSQNIKSTLATDLVGEWSFDDQSNPGRDDSGNGNNSTVYNCTWVNGGKIRGASDFDGNGNYIDFSRNISIGADNFTISFWLKPKNNPPGGNYSGGIVGQGINDGVQIYFSSSRFVCIRVWNGSDYRWAYCTNTQFYPDKWYHVVYTAKRSENGYFYTNGKIDGTGDISFRSSQFLIIFPRIGRDTWLSTDVTYQSFYGTIDEVQIYNHALTAYEIKELYAQGKMRHLAEK